MKWAKQGLIYCPDQAEGWARSRAMLPTPYRLDQDVLRIYCAFCDGQDVGRIGYVDVSADAPRQIIRVSAEPVLDIGEPGTFDDNGVAPMSLVQHENTLRLYYIGFQLGVKRRFSIFSGVAISRDGGASFERCQRTPVTDRTEEGLFIRSSAFVLRDEGLWKMWYVAGSRWVTSQGKQIPYCDIRYLESADGIVWPQTGYVCLEPDVEHEEFAMTRPYVVREDGIYKMYYGMRGISRPYSMGYAESPDGKVWARQDHLLNLDVSPSGWDSEMVCYGSIAVCDQRTYLFYNGNGIGKSGFGYAELSR